MAKPIRKHKQDGTFRADRHGCDLLPVSVPAKPGDLRPRAEAFWNQVSQHLEYAGFISRIDGYQLRLAADAWDLYVEACEKIDADGIVIEEKRKDHVITKTNPAVAVRTAAYAQLQKVLDRFGMSPKARTGLITQLEASEEEDNAEAICGFE